MEVPRNKHRILIDDDQDQFLTKEQSEGRILILLNGLAMILFVVSLALVIFGIKSQNQSKSMIDQGSYQPQKPE